MLAWLVAVTGTAACTWAVTGLLLRWHLDARCAATLLGPVALATVVVWYTLIGGVMTAATEEEARWRVVLAVVSVIAGSFAVLPAAPVWLLMESRSGDRAA